MINFCKGANCPSSEDLVAFERGETAHKRSKQICAHLASCEFCAAELELYAHYPQDNTEAPIAAKVKIPLPLYELAKALLCGGHKDFSLLNRLHRETMDN